VTKKRPRPSGAVPPPKCKAILLCEKTIIEAGTGKVSLIGITDVFWVSTLPEAIQPFSVYLHLTDGIGEYQVSAEFRDLVDDVVIARAAIGTVKWDDRLARVALIMPVPPIEVQHTGTYDLIILADDQEIERRIFMVSIPPETQEDEGRHEP
jgi:hypothetical protein